MRKVDVAIIGAGTAGLTARREVSRQTDSYVVIDDGPLGTTCARVGCMPSKTFIQAANDFHRRHKLEEQGIHGGDGLGLDTAELMRHVRKLRDRFVRGVRSGMARWQENHLLRKQARFLDHHTLDLGDERIQADKIIIATGTRPLVPDELLPYREFLMDTDRFFELETLPPSVAVLGVGVIGLELGQALANLEIPTTIIGRRAAFGGLTDPQINTYIAEKFAEAYDFSLAGFSVSGRTDDGRLRLATGSQERMVHMVLVALGRIPNLDRLNIEILGLETDSRNIPVYDERNFQIPGTSLYLIGDTNLRRPLLHEAADQGRIGGYNAVNGFTCFRERVPLSITFSEPNICSVGQRWQELKDAGVDFVTGTASFEGQGRSIIKLQEIGALHLYAERNSGQLLGAELFAPDGEHLAHLISWAISMELTVHQMLALPYYHPVVEEGLRTAVRDAAVQVVAQGGVLEIPAC